MSNFKQIIDNVSNIEDLDNTTILKVLEKFSKTIKDFAIEQSGLNNLVNVEFIPSDNNTTYTGDSVDYLGTLKLTLSDNIIVNKSCNIKFNIKGSNTIVVDVDEFNNSLELHLDNGTITTLNFAESERQKSETDGAIVHEKEIADVEHIEVLYDKTSSDANINKGLTSGIPFDNTTELNLGANLSSKYKGTYVYITIWNMQLRIYCDITYSQERYSFLGYDINSGVQTLVMGCVSIAKSTGILKGQKLVTGDIGGSSYSTLTDGKYNIYKVEGVLR